MFDWVEQFQDWLGGHLSAIYDALVPSQEDILLAAWGLVSQLPDPITAIDDAFQTAIGGGVFVLKYLSVLDFFMNLPYAILIISLMFMIESILLNVRLWRFGKSMIQLW